MAMMLETVAGNTQNSQSHSTSNNVDDDKTNNPFDIASSACQDYSTSKDQAVIELLLLLHQTGSPIYLFDAIVTICKKYESIGFKITEVPTRKIFLERLKKKKNSMFPLQLLKK